MADPNITKVEAVRKLMRPFVTVALTVTIVYLAITGVLDPEKVFTLGSMVVAFHFGTRNNNK